MQSIITILHLLTAIALIVLILIQHGKGADVGAAFGSGASNTMFGSVGNTPFLVKITAIFAFVFFITSSALSFMVHTQVKQSNMEELPAPAPVKSDSVVPNPVVPSALPPTGSSSVPSQQ